MQVVTNQPKQKIITIFGKTFQLGLQLILGYWASRHGGVSQCNYTIPTIISILAYVLIGLNLATIALIRVFNKFSRGVAFFILIADVLLVISIITAQAIQGHANCVAEKIYMQFSLVQAGSTIVICLFILIFRLDWTQRYANAPGSLVWALLFLMYHWDEMFKAPMMIIGIVSGVISFSLMVMHMFAFVRMSVCYRKVLMGGSLFGIISFVLLQILAMTVYLIHYNSTEYIDVYAIKTLTIFIAVNILDLLFWSWGIKKLSNETGKEAQEQFVYSHGLIVGKHATRMVNDQSMLVSKQIYFEK